MPREHADIKMTPEELRAFLLTDDRLVVGTLDPDGGPWVDAAAFAFLDERVWFRLPADTKTARNIADDPRVCCVVESKPASSSYYDIKGAMIHGRVETVAPHDLAEDVATALGAIDDPVEPGTAVATVTYAVGLDDVVSFIFAKIKYRYEDRPLEQIQADVGLA